MAVDVLPQELDLRVTVRDQLSRFGQSRRGGAAALRTASERHYAVRAGFVAALDDGDVGAMRIVAAGERRLERVFGIEAQARDAAIARFELHQHLRQLV